MTNKRFKISPEWQASISGHPVQKSNAIHFHPCNPDLLPENTCSILFCGTLL